jgi:diguanylate cyclase (GGDEF)-like protein
MDLNGFKAINDSLGHHIGDRVLKQVATRLSGLIREADTIARLGGDEFAFVLPYTDGEGGIVAARKFARSLKEPIVVDGCALSVSGSFGIAWFPEHGATDDTLLQNADIAMYAAKAGSLECAIYTAARDEHAHRRLSLMTELHGGIERDEFFCEYQPLVSLRSGAITCVEALARWRHPQRGL